MKTEIHRLSLQWVNSYLIKEDGLVLVDAGLPNKGKKFLEEFRKLSVEPRNISLILVTHGHWDHIGSLKELKTATGGKVAVNQHETDWVGKGLKEMPPGIGLWGKMFGVMMRMYSSWAKLSGTPVDLVLEDKELSLESYGIHGKALHTPGHSTGSTSLLLDTGDAFVGDLAMNGLPLRFGAGLPRFADDIVAVKKSWRLLLDRGARWIYPGHGKPFKADALERLL